MLKNILTQIYDVLLRLDRDGYFANPKTVLVAASKKVEASAKVRGPNKAIPSKGKKLYAEDVLEIYNEKTLSSVELGELYGVTSNTINDIKAGRTWRKVTRHKNVR